MNFWRTPLLPLVFALALFFGGSAGNACAEPGEWVCDQDSDQPTWLAWTAQNRHEFVVSGAFTTPADQEFPAAPVKRTRKCWRPSRTFAVVIIVLRSTVESRSSVCGSHEPVVPAVPVSDLLFADAGYTRLFQKG